MQPTGNAIAKSCTKCGETKPLGEFFRHTASKDGYRPDCKMCKSAKNKANYAANRDRELAYRDAYNKKHRERLRAQKKAHYDNNRKRILDAQRAYREENPERYRDTRDAWREANSERLKAYRAERWATNPDYRSRAYAAATRRQRLLDGALSEPYLRDAIFERDAWKCGVCGEDIDPQLRFPDSGSPSIDHIVPVSHGGDDTPANVQAAHLGCNSGRGNRPLPTRPSP